VINSRGKLIFSNVTKHKNLRMSPLKLVFFKIAEIYNKFYTSSG
jgi:hypothetical protein